MAVGTTTLRSQLATVLMWKQLCRLHADTSLQSHKSFRTKQKLARAQKQNRPIPQWIRLRTGNTIRYVHIRSPAHGSFRSSHGWPGQIQCKAETLAQDSHRHLKIDVHGISYTVTRFSSVGALRFLGSCGGWKEAGGPGHLLGLAMETSLDQEILGAWNHQSCKRVVHE